MLCLAALALSLVPELRAQVDPTARWRTIETPHFRVTFTPEVETVARRAALKAEKAHAGLSAYFHPPRGKVDLVVSDNYDISNGYASAFPTNRIVIYANPPVSSSALRFTDDHIETLVTHELTHIFQLDRATGIWGFAQKLFGRSPYLFPNAYQPSWALEGLAVRYESRLTGSGRIIGSEHRMIARTLAMSGRTPRLDQLSLASPHFPFGYSTYAFGSLFVDWLGDTHGDSALRKYVEAGSRNILPMLLNPPARRAFGWTLTRAYQEWARLLADSAPPQRAPMRGWRDLTREGAYASNPRWADDSTILYVGTPGRETYGLYRLRIGDDGVQRTRLARRHTDSPQSILADGSLVYAELEFVDAYTLRSDLYMDRARGGRTRLTRNARLSMPDARPDGRIVAVQTVPGATRLALVSRDGKRIDALTRYWEEVVRGDTMPEFWMEPRWSPDGTRIAAVRRDMAGWSSVVVLDTTGVPLDTVFSARAVVAKPSWSSDGRQLFFSSDHDGVPNLYRATIDSSALVRVSDAATGLFEPQPSPGDRSMAAVVFRADGYHIGIAPLDSAPLLPPDSVNLYSPVAGVFGDSAPARAYSPLRSLLPRYWVPFVEEALTEDGWRVGAYTSGQDLVGRHAYQALVFVPTDNSGITGSLYYRNARFGQPIVELVGSQDWENYRRIFNSDDQMIGRVRRRIRDGSASLTFQRPRMRTFAYASVGGGVEQRVYATDPPWLLQDIPAAFRGVFHYPRVALSAGWSNTQFPALAISPEDGISISTTARYRWRTSDSLLGTHSVIGAISGFKSIPLPGFAHHVAALRIAAGESDDRATGYLEVGGVSGGTLDVLPGYTLGEGRRTFQVRGFPSASLLGMRAMTANLEYRAPLLLPGRGLGALPLFLDRTSITVFGDAGTAWCSGIYPTRTFPDTAICTEADHAIGRTVAPSQLPLVYLDRNVIASAGAELNVTAAVLSWDAPFRYRLGVAFPVAGRELVPDAKPATVYFSVGASF